jgi:hypothetical protein
VATAAEQEDHQDLEVLSLLNHQALLRFIYHQFFGESPFVVVG